jgi:hypothetical protein
MMVYHLRCDQNLVLQLMYHDQQPTVYRHMVYAQMYVHHDQMTLREEYMVYAQLIQYEEHIIHDHLHLSFYHGMCEQGDLIILVSLSEEKNTYRKGLKRQKDQCLTVYWLLIVLQWKIWKPDSLNVTLSMSEHL